MYCKDMKNLGIPLSKSTIKVMGNSEGNTSVNCVIDNTKIE